MNDKWDMITTTIVVDHKQNETFRLNVLFWTLPFVLARAGVRAACRGEEAVLYRITF
eukprot:COSAG06_NODE_30945_length_528_cov_1.434884_1_plen_56_part_01